MPEPVHVSELDEVIDHGLLAAELAADGRAVRDRRLERHLVGEAVDQGLPIVGFHEAAGLVRAAGRPVALVPASAGEAAGG